ncbi:MAG TPA: arginine deiminase family protein [Pyrinomonadaceae bacterium]|jgi:dimethylargininase|nr:arginine deiminase family protein [Pyrinomonadaceae bacterium]
MSKAITRAVSREIGRCELTYRRRECVDYTRAVRQHGEYCALLRRHGVEVLTLEACDSEPDGCFVADTALVLAELAVVGRMGAASRRGETAAVAEILSTTHELARIRAPATFDGGDAVVIGRQIFVGHSRRTNREGIESLSNLTKPFGYRVTPVRVAGSLHLTTACSVLDRETLLVNPRWIDASAFGRFQVLQVTEDEDWAANTISVGETVVVEAGAPRTHELVARHCRSVETLDISEFRKAEGSLACLSILFADAGGRRTSRNREVMYAE